MVNVKLDEILSSPIAHDKFINEMKEFYGFPYIKTKDELLAKYNVDLDLLAKVNRAKFELANKKHVLPCTNLQTGSRAIGLTYPIFNIAEFFFDNEIFFIGYDIFYDYWGYQIDNLLERISSNAVNLLEDTLDYMDKNNISDLHFFKVNPFKYHFTKRQLVDVETIGFLDAATADDLIRTLRVESGNDPFTSTPEIKGSFTKKLKSGKERSFRISMVQNDIGQDSGYSVSIRLLASNLRDLRSLNYPPEIIDIITLGVTSHDDGIIIVSGGTNTGKSTLLYSVLNILRERGDRIITIENPIELTIPDIIQIDLTKTEHADEKNKMTIPRAIQVILRQDPDVALIGEVRNEEEVKGVLQLSETGHLSFTTVHANSCLGTISRLKNLNVDNDMLALNLRMIINQSLVRKLCGTCKIPVDDRGHFRRGNGKIYIMDKEVHCPECNPKGATNHRLVGYSGRCPVFEIAYFGKLDANDDVMDFDKVVKYYISKEDAIKMQYDRGLIDKETMDEFLGAKIKEFIQSTHRMPHHEKKAA